ncbi:putative mRNA capping nucleoside-triphosphatase [Aspergillus saccharolyticus JOP 1030-1]|uniref:mRNA-capping enzyme subunit beta n=1 Tax=Aspergillus saccharolyticus JOP 1030-1 TaxID=1450539 RepID=A0A319AL65_9EURO|nr:mRNA triphosphatase CET1 [Aspergillus saccharolyticus JOP 1030-1]PYH47342.1 mRNA triphosphatase CET1 [Aspergillus saccharolyticus JOP 1030-1]
MDLRSMLNTDTAGNANNRPPESQQSPSSQTTRKLSDPVYSPREQVPAAAPASSASYPVAFPGGSIQRPHVSPERSSSYGSLQSPYQYHPPSGRSAGSQAAQGQSPQPAQYVSSRDSPFNPPQQRSQSIQSVLSHDTPVTHASHPKESPSTAGLAPGYSSQQFSPPGPGSLPGTPRGSTAAFPQPSPSSAARPPSSGQDTRSNRASSPWVGQEASMQMSPTAISRLSRPRDQTPRPYPGASDRRGSEDSVSPKTTRAPSFADSAVPTQSTQHENGMIVTDAHANSSPHAPPKRKRRRFEAPPIYAMRPERTKGRGPIIPNPFPPIPKHARDTPANPWILRQRAAAAAAPGPAHAATVPAAVKASPDSLPGKTTAPAPRAPSAALEPQKPGSLGPWEPSITGEYPSEEVTKLVCDFLFRYVVVRNDAIAAPAGAAATAGNAPIIEVEAKLGQLIDMDRGDRVQLPVMTETVINKQFPRFRTAFESSMTVAQHQAMNNFLNEAVKKSLDQADRPRIPISYAHKKERDTFYEVSANDLPPVIRQNLNPRHKPKVRVTVDQRTNEVLAKIVKCRIADLDIHSPNTCVDWRISVNLEMNYDGDVSQLTVVDPARGRGGDRNKDRMSYRHLAYQIDLTQVAKSDSPKGDFEHELEVEVSAAEIRRQGQMAMNGEPHQYEDLVKGFLDNVRVLARQVPR